MGKIRTWLLHADLIGKPFGLKINGRDTHQTIGGAIFSLIGILSVLTYATYSTRHYPYYRIRPTASQRPILLAYRPAL
jgi:hypothetical protein